MNESYRAKIELDFDAVIHQFEQQEKELARIQRWQSAFSLRNYVKKCEEMLQKRRPYLDAKPVITVIGPTGSGKSTLLNALIGKDDILNVGDDRPTTRVLSAVVRTSNDADILSKYISSHDIDIVPYAQTHLKEAIIIDTPDTDSNECDAHIPLLEKVVELSDILLCVFNAENPKRRDNLVQLAPWVQLFRGEQLYIVLNKCDRIPEKQLQESVIKDFQKYISASWHVKYDKIYAVSARSSLNDIVWPENEKPLHSINDFAALKSSLHSIGGATVYADKRIEHAQHLYETVCDVIATEARTYSGTLNDAVEDIKMLENNAFSLICEKLSLKHSKNACDTHAMMWDELNKYWWGPVGISVALCRRLEALFAPLRMLRGLNPFAFTSSVYKGMKAVVKPGNVEKTTDENTHELYSSFAYYKLTQHIESKWPDIAEKLVKVGFSSDVRSTDTFNIALLIENAYQQWNDAIENAVRISSKKLSSSLLKWLLNLPSLLVCVISVLYLLGGFIAPLANITNFFDVYANTSVHLPDNFLLNTFVLFLLMVFLPSWFLQYRVKKKLANLPTQALDMLKHTGDCSHICKSSIGKEAQKVVALSRVLHSGTDNA